MRYRFWVVNLNNDRGRYAETLAELAEAIQFYTNAGLSFDDIGINIEAWPVPTKQESCLCGGVGCNSCEPQGRG